MRGGASIAPDDYKDNGVATVPKGAINSTGIADLSGSKYVSKEFFEKNKNSSVYSDELVTSLRDLVPSAPNMGRIVKLEGKDKRYLMPQGVYNLILLDEVDENFLISFSNTSKFRRIISQEKNGSTQVHIRNSEYLGISIDAPDAEEQNKIGSFFKKLDVTIALHQDKQQKLGLLKKRLVKELFPQDEWNLPHIRFANFNNAWEQHQLKEVLRVNSGRDYKHLNEGDIPVYGTGGYMLSVDGKLSDVDSIGLGRKGTIDKPQYLRAPFWTVDTLFYLTPFPNYDIYFLFTLTQSINWKTMDESTGVPSLSKAVIEKVTRTFPSFEEQKKIGLFFKQLDETISHHQQKIDNMKSLKRALLNKMFI